MGMTTDVVVVGAGPAGCAAAYDLAVNGIQTVLVERTRFPRRKPCAGGLTVKAARALRYPIVPVVCRTIDAITVSWRMRRIKRLTSEDPLCYMVERPAFDHFCLEQTQAVGAAFTIVGRIDAVEEDPRGVRLFTDRGPIRCRFLVGADGVHSRIRRLTGRFPELRAGFAVEGTLDVVSTGNDSIIFDFDYIPGGYGWAFPKKSHLNIGLYTHRSGVTISRRDLAAYARLKRHASAPMTVAGYGLGMGGWRYRPGSGRVMLVGDAAGLVDPLLGEGLYHAIVSGQLAADAIGMALGKGGDACRAYARALAPIRRELLVAQATAACFYGMPRAGHSLLISPAARIPLTKGFARGLSLTAILRNGFRFWVGRPPAGSMDSRAS